MSVTDHYNIHPHLQEYSLYSSYCIAVFHIATKNNDIKNGKMSFTVNIHLFFDRYFFSYLNTTRPRMFGKDWAPNRTWFNILKEYMVWNTWTHGRGEHHFTCISQNYTRRWIVEAMQFDRGNGFFHDSAKMLYFYAFIVITMTECLAEARFHVNLCTNAGLLLRVQ